MTDPDPKLINRTLLLLDQAARALKGDPPDLRIVQTLLSSALGLVFELTEPPNPYADTKLRPGLTVGEAAARGMVAPPPLMRLNPDGSVEKVEESNDV